MLFQVISNIMSQRVCIFFVPGCEIDESFSGLKSMFLSSEAEPEVEVHKSSQPALI
jgi:hypothetical protein